MAERIARGVFRTDTPVRIRSYAAVVGEKEGEGPLGSRFDLVEPDAYFGQPTWEAAESAMLRRCLSFIYAPRNKTIADSRAALSAR